MMFSVVILGVVGCASAALSKPRTTLDVQQHLSDFFPKGDASLKPMPASALHTLSAAQGDDDDKMLHFAYSYSDRCDDQLFFVDQVIFASTSHLLSLVSRPIPLPRSLFNANITTISTTTTTRVSEAARRTLTRAHLLLSPAPWIPPTLRTFASRKMSGPTPTAQATP